MVGPRSYRDMSEGHTGTPNVRIRNHMQRSGLPPQTPRDT
jgi:hypothetical protein